MQILLTSHKGLQGRHVYKRRAQTLSIYLCWDLHNYHLYTYRCCKRQRPAILEARPNKRSIGPVGLAGSVEREVVEVAGANWGFKGLERRGLRAEMPERGLAPAPQRRTSTMIYLSPRLCKGHSSAAAHFNTPTNLYHS